MRRWILCLALACAACGEREAPASAAAPVTVFAAASVKEAITAIAQEWERRSGRTVRLRFEATSTLARQIREGAPADVFVTAAPEWLDAATPIERFDWLSNRLVVVVRKEVGEFDLARAESLALAGERVPAGKYARAALDHLKIALPARILYGAHVRDVLAKVSQGGAQAGIVYATDVPLDPDLRIAWTLPADSHPKILYSVGLRTAAGKGFLDALREPWAQEIVRRLGFLEPK